MAIPKAGAEPLVELETFLRPYAQLLRRAESRAALERYSTGLLADVARKTASGIGRALPNTSGQNLQEFLTRTDWDACEMDRLRIKHMLTHASAGSGVLVIDDTGFAKKGKRSVGVARQYSGTLGRVDNCQVLVTVNYVDAVFDGPVNARVYLPESWTEDPARCRKAKVPEEIAFATKGEIALALIDQARNAGIEPRAAVTDAGYGDQPPFLDGLEARELAYAAAVGCEIRFRLAAALQADPGDPPPPARRPKGWPRKKTGLEDRVAALPACEPPQAPWRPITTAPYVLFRIVWPVRASNLANACPSPEISPFLRWRGRRLGEVPSTQASKQARPPCSGPGVGHRAIMGESCHTSEAGGGLRSGWGCACRFSQPAGEEEAGTPHPPRPAAAETGRRWPATCR